jgi:hypothetical protein
VLKVRLGLVVLLAACGLALVPAVGLAGPTSAQGFHKLIEFTGKGTKNSKGFHITSKSIQVAYSYSQCPNGTGTFIVDLVNHTVTKPVVSVLGHGAKKRVWAYPRPGTYRISVNTTCRWYVAVYGK